jgi:hypothetical protein
VAYYRRPFRTSYPASPTPISGNSEIPSIEANKERISNLKNVEGWQGLMSPADSAFVESITGWLDGGRNLSAAQDSWLQRIEKKCVPTDTSWYDLTDTDLQKKREYAIMHYNTAGFYVAEVLRMQSNAAYMPEKSVWERMWGNKYINAGFKRWTEGSRFNVGEVVINKYYPAYYGTTGLIHNVTFKGGAWSYEYLPMNAKEGYDMIISVEEKNLLPASKRNLTALDKAAARKKEEPTF